MAVDNIDLSGEIKAWKDAAYGKDVRAANVAAFEKIQGTVNETVQNVNQASSDASSASQNAQKAVNDIQSAIETATSKASEAAGSATAADTSKKAAASSAAAEDNSKTQAAASAAEAKKIAQGLGDFDGTAAKVKATDTYGLVVSALGESTAQALIDAIANKVMNELINKNKIVNNLLATDASTVLAGTQGTALDKRLVAAENAVTKLNSDLWPGGLKTAFAVKDSSNANNLAIIRGYQNGAVSLGAENAPGTAYRRLQINTDGTVVYYYKPDGVAIPKAVTLVSLSDLS